MRLKVVILEELDHLLCRQSCQNARLGQMVEVLSDEGEAFAGNEGAAMVSLSPLKYGKNGIVGQLVSDFVFSCLKKV